MIKIRRNLILVTLAIAFLSFAALTPFGFVSAEEADDALNTNVNTQRDRVSGEAGNIGDTSSSDFQRQQQVSRQAFDAQTNNSENIPCGYTDVGCWILKAINYIVDTLGNLLGIIPIALFTGAINLNAVDYISTVPAVKIGWGMARDVANMFFIIILVIVAIATIFDLQSFNVKTILPKLILVALIINFSMVIGLFVIQQSNSLANVFYQRLVPQGKTLQNSLENIVNFERAVAEIQGQVTQRTNMAGGVDAVISAHKSKVPWDITLNSWGGGPGQFITVGKEQCGDGVDKSNYGGNQRGICENWENGVKAAINGEKDIYWRIAISIVAKLFVYPVAAFVFLAGAALLIVRYVALVFLLILAPLAFLSYLLPSRLNQWTEWWTKLFSYSFFFPAFMFCLMFSFLLLAELQTMLGGFGETLLSYALGIAFLIGSLIVSQKMGVAGASTAVGLGKKYSTGVKNWAKARTLRAGAGAMEATSTQLSKMAGGEGMGRFGRLATLIPRTVLARPAARAAEALARAGGAAVKEHEESYKKLDSRALASEYNRAVSPETQNTILKIASEEGKLKDFSDEQKAKAYTDALAKGEKGVKMARAIENAHPETAIEHHKKREAAAQTAFNDADQRARIDPDNQAAQADLAQARQELGSVSENVQRQKSRVISSITKKNIEERLSEKIFDDPEAVREMARSWSKDQIEAAMDRFGQTFIDQYTRQLEELAKSTPNTRAEAEFNEIINDPAMRKFIITSSLFDTLAPTAKQKAIARAQRGGRQRAGDDNNPPPPPPPTIIIAPPPPGITPRGGGPGRPGYNPPPPSGNNPPPNP